MPNLPSRMTVIAIRAPGGSEVLVPEERPVPALGPGEVMVKIAAAGVNRPDVAQRMGFYPPPKGASDIPGLEILADLVDRFWYGDAGLAAEIRLQRQCFGLTSLDRRRLQWEIARGEEAEKRRGGRPAPVRPRT